MKLTFKFFEMIKILFLLAFVNPLFCFSQTEKVNSEFRYPAEWRPMDGIWIGLANKSFLAGPSVEQGMASCIKVLQNYVTVKMTVGNDSALLRHKKLLSSNGIDTNKIRFIIP